MEPEREIVRMRREIKQVLDWMLVDFAVTLRDRDQRAPHPGRMPQELDAWLATRGEFIALGDDWDRLKPEPAMGYIYTLLTRSLTYDVPLMPEAAAVEMTARIFAQIGEPVFAFTNADLDLAGTGMRSFKGLVPERVFPTAAVMLIGPEHIGGIIVTCED